MIIHANLWTGNSAKIMRLRITCNNLFPVCPRWLHTYRWFPLCFRVDTTYENVLQVSNFTCCVIKLGYCTSASLYMSFPFIFCWLKEIGPCDMYLMWHVILKRNDLINIHTWLMSDWPKFNLLRKTLDVAYNLRDESIFTSMVKI